MTIGDAMEIKKGEITDIIFHNESNGYTIAIMETEEEQLTVVGTLPNCIKGSTYRFTGTFKVHPKYGEQFAFTECEEVLPTTVGGIEGFLASGIIRGVGPKTAKLLVTKYGEDTLKVIEDDPMVLTSIPGIGEKKAETIGEAFREHREFATVSIYFRDYGIGDNEALKLYKAYGTDAISIVNENPYIIIEEVPGMGFKRADAIAEKLGIDGDNQFRIESGILYALSYYAGEGSTYVPQELLCDKAAELLDVDRSMIKDSIVQLAFQGKIHVDNLEGMITVYLFPYYKAEQQVCKNISILSQASIKPIAVDLDAMIRKTSESTGIQLSENQKDAVKSSLTGGISIITGGPGTGKTTIINTIINILEESGHSPLIAAPTGRAAKRITETCGHYASTIHRLLGFSFSEETNEMCFSKNSENPLECDAVIVDEASMIDILLMDVLLKAIKPGTRLILVGDVDQLPSVGAGRVLQDIIDSEYVYTVKLTEIFRQAQESLIVVNAHRINKGEPPFCNEEDKDFFLMRKNKESEILETIKELVSGRLSAYYDWCDPIRDIQILTPVRKGTLGTYNLNKVLQEIFNPHRDIIVEKTYGDKVFRENDKVMQIRNNYQIGWRRKRDFSEGEGVFNGDVGFIQKIDTEFNQFTVVFDEDKYVIYEYSQLDELELAYATTVHKSQGSEFPIVVMPISWFPPMLATRNLLYTAVTRGKKIVVLVGSENQMNAMVGNNRIRERYTGLKERLVKLIRGEV